MSTLIMWLVTCILVGIYFYVTERDQSGLPTSSLLSCILITLSYGCLFVCLIAFIYFIVILKDPLNIF
jgi:hypothetical protein